MRVAIIGTYPPRQCGIATFTQDLYKALPREMNEDHAIVAISDGSELSFPEEVRLCIARNEQREYIDAAQYINTHFDMCVIQHEYGIFGGDAGDFILSLTDHLKVPVVSNLHTVLEKPNPVEHRVLKALCERSNAVTVMTEKAIELLRDVFTVPVEKMHCVSHGVPTFDYNQVKAKNKLGLAGKSVMLSFGFLGRGKGIETAIDAVKHVNDPNFQYLVLGSTHPNVLREEGDSYRTFLQNKIDENGLADKIKLINTFASEDLLIEYLTACDIYVTPYPNENQISSGTLTFAIGAGAAVISTPYWYAKDLLANDRGLLFDFKNEKALANQINTLLDDPLVLAKYRRNAATYGRMISWQNVGKQYYELLKTVGVKTIEISTPSRQKVKTLFTADSSRLSS
ncbi:glycosyltransferase family 4 protein [Sphingobacterium paludis]|uniref:Glycosyltransferase involved in cell wall biosynthesis n=1 Tax=Sphingobacterium paludis TaxID=1476465 RepID=A0A4R7CWW0_9SPHI|nr:glycosyltransferase family 4 protein [Sphingobacterium paludis]TDS12161.1 glycosyltransferase involved in cell wall biosynthesis [Sphingobacterium paludis]